MIKLALLRHGPTDWNRQKRLQGRADIPLAEDGRASLAAQRPGPIFDHFVWRASPLSRAVETARALGQTPVIDPELIEMDWGGWEGRSLAELRTDPSVDMAAAEARGLDLMPPGGESPRQVQARLAPWLAARAADRRDVVAVTHKGVIRALMALAFDWSMTGKPPVKLDWTRLHMFKLDDDGSIRPVTMNLALLAR